MPEVILTSKLTKIYRAGFWKNRSLCALDQLDLQVFENEVFGYLGPNGAGKSTTLKLLMSLIYPTSGTAEILGKPVTDVSTRHHIGYLPENPFFYEYLTAQEFLSYYAGLFDLPPLKISQRVEHLLKLTDVYHARKLQLRKFSKGMIQRVGIAQALVNDPKIVFLDEPMSGLDPIGRREVRDLILRLKKEGKTVFFSTHILNDVETLCDRVGVLCRGRLIGSGRLNELISQEVSHMEVIVDNVSLETLREVLDSTVPIRQTGSTLQLELTTDRPVGPLVSAVEGAGGKILSATPVRQTMEDYFFNLLGNAHAQPDQALPQPAGKAPSQNR
ncbi:MAG: ABC transporter ATP-binding protein [Acidobacteriota bacterium]